MLGRCKVQVIGYSRQTYTYEHIEDAVLRMFILTSELQRKGWFMEEEVKHPDTSKICLIFTHESNPADTYIMLEWIK